MSNEVAHALLQVLASPNVADANLEPANIVDVIAKLGDQVVNAARLLGVADATTAMGALEAHGKAVLDGCGDVASAIRELAAAVRESRPPTGTPVAAPRRA